MKILFLTKYYKNYLDYFENKHSLENMNFSEHQELLFNDHFSWPSDFSILLNNKKYETEFIITNYENLQRKWALENNFKNFNEKNWEKKITFRRIQNFKPDIIWIFAIYDFFGKFLDEASVYTSKIVTWISSPYPKKLSFDKINSLITSDEGLFVNNNHKFEKKLITLPGFNSEIAKKIKKNNFNEKKFNLCFSGQFTIDHKIRTHLISNLIRAGIDINVSGILSKRPVIDYIKNILNNFLNGDVKKINEYIFNLRTYSHFYKDINLIKKFNIRPIFGIDYYQYLINSDLLINIHSDDSGNYGGAQRLVESTGVGACLLTDRKLDILSQFRENEEILCFDNYEELTNKIEQVKIKQIDKNLIAKKGQQKTLGFYTLENMFQKIKESKIL